MTPFFPGLDGECVRVTLRWWRILPRSIWKQCPVLQKAVCTRLKAMWPTGRLLEVHAQILEEGKPCPSFPWLFVLFYQGEPRVFCPCRTHKTLEKQEKTPILARKFLAKKQPRSQRAKGDQPEGMRKHLLSKKVFLGFRRVFLRKKAF